MLTILASQKPLTRIPLGYTWLGIGSAQDACGKDGGMKRQRKGAGQESHREELAGVASGCEGSVADERE